jgi:hypothetical protein
MNNFNELYNIIKAKNDIEYFADNFIRIVGTNSQLENIKLSQEQRELIRAYNNTDICSLLFEKRQVGKSTVLVILILHSLLFSENNTNILFTRRSWDAERLIYMVSQMYDNLPEYFKFVKISKKTSCTLEFENNSRIMRVNSINQTRGMEISNVFLDEFDFLQENFYDIVSHLKARMRKNGFKIFGVSTTKALEIPIKLEHEFT